MKYYKFNGYAMQKGKNTWERFLDSAVFPCPDMRDPYEFFNSQLKGTFTHWLINFVEVQPPVKK